MTGMARMITDILTSMTSTRKRGIKMRRTGMPKKTSMMRRRIGKIVMMINTRIEMTSIRTGTINMLEKIEKLEIGIRNRNTVKKSVWRAEQKIGGGEIGNSFNFVICNIHFIRIFCKSFCR